MEKFKNYILINEIGRGGMAEVYQAVQMGVLGIERVVALKRMIPHISTSEKMVKLFMREGKLALQLQHPNIVATYDFGIERDIYYLAMEFIEGWDLKGLMRMVYESGETFPLSVAIYIVQSILKGLDFAHNLKDVTGEPLNIVHRDISPGNVMITTSGVVKISDFGVARATIGEEYTIGGSIAGKFSYLSPEMVSGLPVDRRSDIFAAGVIFIELLTGEKLFSGEEFGIMRKIREEYAEGFVERMHIPQPLKKILFKFIAKDVNKRYQSDEEAISDLNDFIFKHLFQNVEDEFIKFISQYSPQIKLSPFNKKVIEDLWNNKTASVQKTGALVKRLIILLLVGGAFAGFYFYEPWRFFKEKENGLRKVAVVSTKGTRLSKPAPVPPSRTKKSEKKFVTEKKHRKQMSRKRGGSVKNLRRSRGEEKSKNHVGSLHAKLEMKVEEEKGREKAGKSRVLSTLPGISRHATNSEAQVKSPSGTEKIEDQQSQQQVAVFKKETAPGFLTIFTTPWANIYIDNKDYGDTPVFKLKLPPGKHNVHLYSPQTGIERKFEVEIKSGKTLLKKISMEAGK